MTFDQCRDAYIASHRAGWRNVKHASQWSNTLTTYATPVFGKLPVAAVDTALVTKVIEPLWTTKPETASRVRGRIERVLDWATTRGYRVGDNPARWRGHLDNLLPARSKVRRVKHHAALPYSEMPDFMVALRAREGVAARALEFAILTTVRTGGILGAKWDEIDFANKVWVVPSDRMKIDRGENFRVPLSAPALAILKQMQKAQQNDYVFPGGQREILSNMAMEMVLRRMGQPVTVHGTSRATFKTWASERASFPNEVVEAALAHTVGNKVEAAYRRGDMFDKRRKLMEAWAEFCWKSGPVKADVIPLRPGRPK